MIRWPMMLAAHEARVTGPEDEFDEEVNGDPDSLTGEDDERGYDEMAAELGWPEEALADQGFDDAEGSDDDDDEADGDDDEGAE